MDQILTTNDLTEKMQQRRLTDFFNSPSCFNESKFTGKLTMLNLSSTETSTSSPVSRKRKSRSRNDLHQTIIDAGQKKIGLQHCAKCGMVYNVDDKNDVEHHNSYHNRFTDKKCYRVTVTQIELWKQKLFWEEVKSPVNGIIFRLSGTSTTTLKRKFEEIIKNFVNEEIGYCSDLPIWDNMQLRQALVFVSHLTGNLESPFIAGILLVDPVKTATLMPQKKHFQGQFLSANRIWVHTQLRRKGLATFLLDSACRIFTRGECLPRTRIAFNDPTDAGIRLACSYIGDKENGRYIIHLSYHSLYNTGTKFDLEKNEKCLPKRIKTEETKNLKQIDSPLENREIKPHTVDEDSDEEEL